MAKLRALISKDLLVQNQILHESKEGFGGSGWKHAEIIFDYARKLSAQSMLDYGCGESTLANLLRKMGSKIPLAQYDPAVKRYARLPNPADFVVCTDVLEHVEPDKLRNVIGHIYGLSKKGAYLAIATRPANKILPNGKNAHLIIEDTPYWREQVAYFPWKIVREDDRRKGNGDPHEIWLWLTV